MAAVALCLGLVEVLPDALAFLQERLSGNLWNTMRLYRRAVVRDGLRATEPISGLLAGLVALAEKGLRSRGRGEERFLVPVQRRLDARAVPADRVVRLFQRGGVPAIVSHLQL